MRTGSQNVTIGSSISAVTLQYPASQWILNDFHMQKSESIHFRWAVWIRKDAIVNHDSFRVSSTPSEELSQNTHHVPEEKVPPPRGRPPAGSASACPSHRPRGRLCFSQESRPWACCGEGEPACAVTFTLNDDRRRDPFAVGRASLRKCLWWPSVVILQNPTLKAIMDSRSYVPSYYWDGLLGANKDGEFLGSTLN